MFTFLLYRQELLHVVLLRVVGGLCETRRRRPRGGGQTTQSFKKVFLSYQHFTKCYPRSPPPPFHSVRQPRSLGAHAPALRLRATGPPRSHPLRRAHSILYYILSPRTGHLAGSASPAPHARGGTAPCRLGLHCSDRYPIRVTLSANHSELRGRYLHTPVDPPAHSRPHLYCC